MWADLKFSNVSSRCMVVWSGGWQSRSNHSSPPPGTAHHTSTIWTLPGFSKTDQQKLQEVAPLKRSEKTNHWASEPARGVRGGGVSVTPPTFTHNYSYTHTVDSDHFQNKSLEVCSSYADLLVLQPSLHLDPLAPPLFKTPLPPSSFSFSPDPPPLSHHHHPLFPLLSIAPHPFGRPSALQLSGAHLPSVPPACLLSCLMLILSLW